MSRSKKKSLANMPSKHGESSTQSVENIEPLHQAADGAPQISDNTDLLAEGAIILEQEKQSAKDTVLSRLQKRILRKLGKFGKAPWWGISTKRLRRAESKTPARNAAFARALVRLEKRGLVIRTNVCTGIPGLGIIRTKTYEPPVRRTSHVILTQLGRRVARSLRQFPDTSDYYLQPTPARPLCRAGLRWRLGVTILSSARTFDAHHLHSWNCRPRGRDRCLSP